MTSLSDTIIVPFDQNLTPRQQIEGALAPLSARKCPVHPHELRRPDNEWTVERVISGSYPHTTGFSAVFERCAKCPHNTADIRNQVSGCAVGSIFRGSDDWSTRDETGRPVPTVSNSAHLVADETAASQFQTWLARASCYCRLGEQELIRGEVRMSLPFESYTIQPCFTSCVQCDLERLGILPDDAFASFDGFGAGTPVLRQLLDRCRAFAADPTATLLMLGNCGTGKTHLAIAILRELIHQGWRSLTFIKHRDFLAEHAHSQRPVAFRQERPESPLPRCQETQLLVYDELTAPTERQTYEDLLLDLFETRIGRFKPSVITANLSKDQLETALGSRLFDRLRRVASVLEFGFESKRAGLAPVYMKRCRRQIGSEE